MFQSFEERSDPAAVPPRVEAVRALMRERGFDWLVVPHADEYQSEYLPRNAERLLWLTGFTGSAGAAIVGRERAVLFVDGRYTLQAREQAPALFEHASLVDEPPAKWIEGHVGEGETVACDPMMHTREGLRALRKAAGKAGARLEALGENLVDRAWEAEGTRPPPPAGAVAIHHERFAGRLARDKLVDLRAAVRDAGADMAVLSETAGVSWAFNIRGADVVHKPLVLARAIVHAAGYPDLFVADAKLDIETHAYLTQLADLHEPDAFLDRLREAATDRRVLLDPRQAPAALFDLVEEVGTVVEGREPTELPKARKNETELEGARAAQGRDGAAVATFLHWLDRQPAGSITEIDAARELEETRRRMALRDKGGNETPLREISFDTISGAGPNGAIVHYRVTERSNRPIERGLYLSDSGAQYDDGTTDITRTVAMGDPTAEERRCYTLVLRGHVAVARLRFPEGTRGQDLDPFARRPLWEAGMDYAHGTGHGVGSYLGVHEGPQSLSKRGAEPLVPGMILSNEPGYYREGAFGIRIENLVVVHEPEEIEGGDAPMLGFETITLAPFDRRLIDVEMLDEGERRWVDAYHARVREALSERLEDDAREWLERATAPL